MLDLFARSDLRAKLSTILPPFLRSISKPIGISTRIKSKSLDSISLKYSNFSKRNSLWLFL